MDSELKKPKEGAVARLREAYYKRRSERVLSEELIEALKKQEPVKRNQPKRTAKSDRDEELS
jgi:hypothetical protein